MTYPACYETDKQHAEWIALARIGHDVCSICDDCTVNYETEMILQNRCHRAAWEVIEVNKRERNGKERGAPGRTVEQQQRLERLREIAGDRARAYLSRDQGSIQEGGEL